MESNQTDAENARLGMKCKYTKVIAYFDCLILLTSVTLYILLLQTFFKHKNLLARSLLKQHVTSLALINLVSYLITMPLSIVSNFQCRWAFPYWTCVFNAAITYFNGISCMYITCLLSYQRLKLIHKKFESNNTEGFVSKKTKTYRLKSQCLILLCFVASAFWSIAPIVGWSKYSYSKAEMACKMDVESKGWNVITFNLSLFLFTFLFPQLFIVITNILFWVQVKKYTRKRACFNFQAKVMQKRLNLEVKVTKKILIIIGLYSFTWTPRASLGIYSWLTGTGRHDLNYGLHAATIIIGRACSTIAAITFVYLDDYVKRLISKKINCRKRFK